MRLLFIGGCKSGKSSTAQRIAKLLGKNAPLYYWATMEPHDDEDLARIRRHIADRDGMGFETVEQGRDIAKVLTKADPNGSFLLDSVTALLLNELFPDPTSCEMDEDAADRCQKGLGSLCDRVSNLVLVSDYIYSDAARYDEVTENYRRGLAKLDRYLASRADTVIEVSAGNLIFHKGGIPK